MSGSSPGHPNNSAHDIPYHHERYHPWAFHSKNHNFFDPASRKDHASLHQQLREDRQANKDNNEATETTRKSGEGKEDSASCNDAASNADRSAPKHARRESIEEEDSLVEPITIEKDHEASNDKSTPDIMALFPPTPSYFHPPLALPKVPKQEVVERPDSSQSFHHDKGMSPAADELLLPPPLLPSPFRGLGGTPPFLDEAGLLDPRHIIQLLTRKVCIRLDSVSLLFIFH